MYPAGGGGRIGGLIIGTRTGIIPGGGGGIRIPIHHKLTFCNSVDTSNSNLHQKQFSLQQFITTAT